MNDITNGLKQIYSWNVQNQLVLGISMFVLASLTSQLFAHWLAPAALVWIGVWVFVLGIVFGTPLSMLVIIYPIIAVSPWYIGTPVHLESIANWLLETFGFIVLAWIAGETGYLIKHSIEAAEKAKLTFSDTQLPNTKGAAKHLKNLLDNNEVASDKLDLLSVKLHNFDNIKALAGHKKANELVRQLAESLASSLGGNAQLAQSASDHLIGFADTTMSLEELEKNVKEQIKAFAATQPAQLSFDASTNVRQSPKSDPSIEDPEAYIEQILKEAENQFSLSISETLEHQPPNLTSSGMNNIAKKIIAAITQQDLTIHYQPRLTLRSGYFTAIEAMPHWQHPQQGSIYLNDFAELISEAKQWPYFTQWMIQQTLRDAQSWQKKGYKFNLTMALPFEHYCDEGSLRYLLTSLPQYKLNNGVFTVSVRVDTLLQLEPSVREQLKQLQALGVHIIISDFGSNSTTLQSLRDESVDAVKFSGKLVTAATHNSDRKSELSTLIRMATSRGLTTIAENISDKNTLLAMKKLGVDELQGPLLSRAIPKKDIPWSRFR